MTGSKSHSRDLRDAQRRLVAVWMEVGTVWRDEVQRRFTLDYWQPLHAASERMARATEELESELARVEQDARD